MYLDHCAECGAILSDDEGKICDQCVFEQDRLDAIHLEEEELHKYAPPALMSP